MKVNSPLSIFLERGIISRVDFFCEGRGPPPPSPKNSYKPSGPMRSYPVKKYLNEDRYVRQLERSFGTNRHTDIHPLLYYKD